MPSPPGAVYFPSLDQCLNGDKALLSWRLAAPALQDAADDRITSDSVSDFLRDPRVHSFLQNPPIAFGKPDAASKSDFDTRTAAINVTPTQNDKYDIKLIKEDALWLSQNADVNEVAALRIVVVEFQNRAQNHLSGPLSTQDIINIQQAVGADGTQASALLAAVTASETLDVETIWTTFNTEASRRRRLLDTYMSERRYFMMFVDNVLHFMLDRTSPKSAGPIAGLRQQLLEAVFGETNVASLRHARRESLLKRYIDLLAMYIGRAESKPMGIQDGTDLELDWVKMVVTETLHLLSSIFQIVDLNDAFLPAQIVSAWFNFVDAYSFMDQLQALDDQTAETLQPVKSLVCIISMKLLNLPRSIPFLEGDSEVTLYPDEDSYITSEEVLRQLEETMAGAANAGYVTAGPVIFAWTLIVQQMLASHHERQERRDLQQNRQAQEGFEREVQHIEARPGVGRRSSAGSIVSMETQPYDKFILNWCGNSQQQQDMQRIEQLAMAVTAGGRMHHFLTEMAVGLGESYDAPLRSYTGARMRFILLDFLNFSFPVVGYISESISTIFAVLSAGRGYWDVSKSQVLSSEQDIIARAMEDPATVQFYLNQVWLRWPYEFTPFTDLCRVIFTSFSERAISELGKILANTPALTFHLPDAFWEFSGEENDLGRLELVRDVPLFSVLPSRKRLVAGEESFYIPVGTQGQLASDPARIVQLRYVHSTFALLGKRLETNLDSDFYALALGTLEANDLAEAISLLATVIRHHSVAAKKDKPTAPHIAALEVLQEAGRDLPHHKDIVTVITDTLDSYIEGDQPNLDAPSIRVITSCLQFLDSILPICPGRVWSYMTRCDLLMSPSRAGRLSKIISTFDIVEEHFELLVSVVNLFSSLVDSSVGGAVHMKIENKTTGRAIDTEPIWQGTSDKALSQVNLSIAHTSVDILENSLTWRFASEVHRSMLLGDLVPVLTKIISFTFGTGAESDENDNANSIMIGDSLHEKRPRALTPFLEPASRYIIDGFLSSTPSSLRFQPVLASLLVALGLPDSTLYENRQKVIARRQIAFLEFATALIRVANLKQSPVTAIEGQLLKCASLLARLCARNAVYRDPTLSLFGALAERISRDDSEAPSLLGYLGPQISRSFLQTVSKLDKPFDRPTASKNAWTFFSTIMRNGQHWMANCLLTGKTPREALNKNGKTISKLASDSILKTAVNRLRSIKSLPNSEILAILDLLTSAHNYWQWTVFASQEDNSCLNELRAYVRDLKTISVTARADVSRACDEARIAAYIAEAFAMHLYHLRKTGREKDFARDLANDIDYFLRDGVTVADYNSSLHAHFGKNFSKRYPGFSLDSFQRTVLTPRELGKGYYYALDVADKMLDFDPAWSGSRESTGFRHEMEAANLNLSLVDAQVALFHAWEFLLLELSCCLPANEHLITTQMKQVAKQCLECNQIKQGPERIFLRITKSRANLALLIMQRLPPTALTTKDTADLLMTTWTTVSSIENPFVPEHIQHWRVMLRTFYVTLRSYTLSTGKSANDHSRAENNRLVEVIQCVCNVLHQVVAQGFRSLVALIHDADGTVVPEDLALVTAILQACLCLPAIDEYSSEIVNIMISEDVGRAAMSLFSWSDKLTVNGDPVYGELSMLFLLQLSKVPAMAEQLASDGLLAQIAAASITSHIQQTDVKPLAEDPGAQRCYDIWAKGILPLLLNVLSATGLGPNIATEVAYVLNQFPNLLESSIERIEAPGINRTAARGGCFLTLLSVSEVNSLAVLTRVLGGYRTNYNQSIPEVPWDSATVLEYVEYWLTTRNMLRERLMALGQREADWKNMKTDVEGVSVLEDKVVSLLEATREVISEDLE
ncbi:nucleoporin subcomplex protein binding to Pom34-domain-containing protein [Coniella lustricola]|uniref:Nucleoporin NUP188 n=1 Tax=Coniella lustricola TaxID=2025994 RepID=A0A2T3AMW9_9PEZI|nr:nucleoporin subcomplex protein binding to Pom34-domain-containing protein [Coniella lustricola]